MKFLGLLLGLCFLAPLAMGKVSHTDDDEPTPLQRAPSDSTKPATHRSASITDRVAELQKKLDEARIALPVNTFSSYELGKKLLRIAPSLSQDFLMVSEFSADLPGNNFLGPPPTVRSIIANSGKLFLTIPASLTDEQLKAALKKMDPSCPKRIADFSLFFQGISAAAHVDFQSGAEDFCKLDEAGVEALKKKFILLKPELEKLKGWQVSLTDFDGASVFGPARNLSLGFNTSAQQIDQELKTIHAADVRATEAEGKVKAKFPQIDSAFSRNSAPEEIAKWEKVLLEQTNLASLPPNTQIEIERGFGTEKPTAFFPSQTRNKKFLLKLPSGISEEAWKTWVDELVKTLN